ncbi:S26 family signal peptidase [Streptomyces sp. NPDC001480]|uniref:S26 family signal peptidase n=1 Tax=Streptomyces sp. NPDC001480 TaxID=3364577 RepID=UPI0036A68F88
MRRGDVVLLSAPDRYGPGVLSVQWVIGVGGDHIVCRASSGGAKERLTVNGKPLGGAGLRRGRGRF